MEVTVSTHANIYNSQIHINYSETIEVNDSFQIHCHNIFEIYYFIEGDVEYLVEGKLYHPTPHSLLLLSPHVFHGVRVKSEQPYRRFALHFHPDILNIEHRPLLLSAFPSNEKYSHKEVYYESTDDFRLFSFFESFVDCSKQPATLCEQLVPIYLEALLAQLTIMCRTLRPTQIEGNVSNTITEIIAFLNAHLSEPLSLTMLSDKFFISKHYLNRAFRKATGTTVGDYLIYKRIIYAQQLLMNGSSAIEAANSSGFRDYSAFYRAYHRITGHAPLFDRK